MKKNDPTTHTELEHLLTAQEDGILDEAGKERLEEILLADPEARNLYLRHIALCDHLAWEYTENASEPTEFRPRESKPSSPAILHPAWTMAAAAIIIGAFLFLFKNDDPSLGGSLPETEMVATLEFIEGPVAWMDVGGIPRNELSSGDRLADGSFIMESPSSSMQLRFDDGTLLTLAGESEGAVSSKDGKLLRLRKGSLVAKVTKQPKDSPLRIITPTANVEVLGTILNVSSSALQTSVRVEEGSVRVKRLADGQSIEVPASHVTQATLGTSSELAATPIWELPTNWNGDLNRNWGLGRGNYKARERPVFQLKLVSLEAEEYVARRDAKGVPTSRYGVSFNARPKNKPLVELTPSSVIRFRCRLQKREYVNVFLSTNRPNGAFGGNFECNVVIDPANAENGWQEINIPLDKFKVIKSMANRGYALEKNVLSKIIISTHKDRQLGIGEISVTAQP